MRILFIYIFKRIAEPAYIDIVLHFVKWISYLAITIYLAITSALPILYISKTKERKWLDQASMVGGEGGTDVYDPNASISSKETTILKMFSLHLSPSSPLISLSF